MRGDITQVDAATIPDFDILCAGFPCQAFSAAGNRLGFADTRGTLFFDVERILLARKPKGFILENVEGLVNHDGGKTLKTILKHLKAIGYKVSYAVLNSKYFGVPQERKRIYIVGTFNNTIKLDNFPVVEHTLGDILEVGLPTIKSRFTKLLLSKYAISELYGKSIKDKRGGKDNIHSWDIDLKGKTTKKEKELLNLILTERRKKKWAAEYGIDWMDGMPLTKEMIATFYTGSDLQKLLDSLVQKGYLVYEHPKRKITKKVGNVSSSYREQDTNLPKGYNIVTGKLSFEITKILDPTSIAPTLVAMDMQKLVVVDGNGLRKLTLREGLRLFGYPEDYQFDVSEKDGFDLLGNTVVVPVIRAVCNRLIKQI
ncbi:DNA (cytosine-5-)-methyltransferase [Bacteroides nordii]|uniref:DNA (cytosine-5-)-methyltransferase n=1 Tax=Bacteroides nordii TaxID=291645 RepID=UPI001E53DCAB|nr:DNA (cytosine-5-)-methyltransferase [Bacteroides nordii]